MWIFRGGPPDKPALIYQYETGRGGKVASSFLQEYKGVVQTDGYVGYDFLDKQTGVVHVGCWAHALRKFIDARKGSGKGGRTGSADAALSYIRRIYEVEHEGRRDNCTA